MGQPPDQAVVQSLVETVHSLEASSADVQQARDELVYLHMGLVEHLARRFSGRGEPVEDLIQVGMVGLLKAIDRYDPDRGTALAGFATPTVLGEIKRHFRDKGWAIRVPRHLQELRLALVPATEDLTHELRRSPTVAELAERVKVDEDDILQALESSYAYSTETLDRSTDDDTDGLAPVNTLGSLDLEMEAVENRESLKPLLQALPPREQQLIEMRFFQGMTQTRIAEELGISQMHVSRLLSRTLEQLRSALLEDV